MLSTLFAADFGDGRWPSRSAGAGLGHFEFARESQA